MKSNRIQLLTGFLIVALVGTCLIHLVFSKLENIEADSTTILIGSLLRDESIMSKSFLLAQSFEDMQKVGIVQCARLTLLDRSTPRVFYDSTFRSGCSNSSLRSVQIAGLDGNQWRLEMMPKIDSSFYIVKWTCLIMFLTLAALAFRYLSELFEHEQIKRSAIEAQRSYLADLTAQISHDVASPISALRMILNKAPLENETKSFLREAVDRTVGIFESLQDARRLYEQVDIKKMVESLVIEKQLGHEVWANVEWFGSTAFLNVPRHDLLRMLSNIFDNAVESGANHICLTFSRVSDLKSQLIIADNGRAIPPEVANGLGSRGLTVGKSKGSGLGLYQSCLFMKSIGGNLEIKNLSGEKLKLTFPN